MLHQIGGRGAQDSRHLHQWPHRHAGLQHVAVAEADVYILLEYIHVAIGDQQLQTQQGMVMLEGRQQWRKDMAAKRCHAGHPQAAMQFSLNQGCIGLGFFERVQHRSHAGQIAFTGFCERQGTRRACNEACTQFALQAREVLAGGGWGDSQLARGRGDRAALEGFDKGFDGAQIWHGDEYIAKSIRKYSL
ncbi:hypothetical protein D3C72_1620800 [compost metagenome]